MHLHTVGEIRDELRPLAGLSDGGPRRGQVGPMNEALRYWCPLSDQVVALWLETIEGELPAVVCDDEGKPRRRPDGNPVVSGGWPGARFPAGWRERARELVSEYARLRAKHHLSGKPEKPRESFARLRGYLERVLQGKPLERRDAGSIRALLAGILAKRGGPDSERLKKIRAAQEDQASMPSHWVLYQVLLRRLDALPGERALSSLEGVLAPVSAEEAAAFDLPVGVAMPAHLRDKVLRCMEAPVSELIAEGVIPSGEVLARVLPQITAQVQSASLDDPELRRLYGALYAAFRRRRSLLLLSMAEQVQLGELPWVSALGGFRQPLGGAKQARQTLEQVVTLALGSFPQEILPNKLLQELRALVSSAGLAVPLVDELAADIFLGQFSGKFVEAAQIAARLLRGTLYERYYGLPFDRVLALPRASDSQPSVGFAALCTTLAQADAGGRWSAARNGTIIEQQQLLTTQNLAPLFAALDLRQTLGPRLPELARRCFSWVCLSVERPVDGWHARLLVLKNAAYAWRQMMFFLSLCSPAEQASFMAQADEQMTGFDEVFRLCFRPALEGLRGVLAGGKFDDEGRLGEGRRLLGWSTRRHWLG